LTMRVEKDMDLSGILRTLATSGLRIKGVNCEEPSLEDAFNVIVGQNGRPPRNGGEGGSSP